MGQAQAYGKSREVKVCGALSSDEGVTRELTCLLCRQEFQDNLLSS